MKIEKYAIATRVILNRDFRISANIYDECANTIIKIETIIPEELKN